MTHFLLSVSLAALTLRLLRIPDAAAETSLVVPLVGDQPISAEVLGVDTALGRTTWVLHQGAFTGTWTDPQGSFPGTATLIEGSDYASLTYLLPNPDATGTEATTFTLGAECAIKPDGQMVCVEAEEGQTFTTTEVAKAFGIEGGATLAPASATSAPGSGASPTSAPSTPSNTQPSSSRRVQASASALSALVALLAALHLA
ncbi:hypothetical protein FB451DRAFT_1181369 [Mycena latifolia]|nr:hypothetical protein FB451DRAFT_1181369 [Mycena latifolia]